MFKFSFIVGIVKDASIAALALTGSVWLGIAILPSL